MAGLTAVDGHVHIYSDTAAGPLLTAAVDNLARLARAADPCLLLTESTGHNAFGRLAGAELQVEGWRAMPFAADEAALSMEDDAGRKVTLIAGRQIITAERLEVLALATTVVPMDGGPLTDILDDLNGRGVPAVLPWGLGKWAGRRGKILRQVLEARQGKVLLGDNAGRPLGWPRPSAFGAAPVLPGTDPLPLAGRERDVGRFGFMLKGALSPKEPAKDLADRLLSLRGQPDVLGQRLGPFRVVSDQVALRVRARP